MFKVATGDSEGRATHWFASFLAGTFEDWGAEMNHGIQYSLDKHNSNATAEGFVDIGDPLFFESEQDFLLFVLKWS